MSGAHPGREPLARIKENAIDQPGNHVQQKRKRDVFFFFFFFFFFFSSFFFSFFFVFFFFFFFFPLVAFLWRNQEIRLEIPGTRVVAPV